MNNNLLKKITVVIFCRVDSSVLDVQLQALSKQSLNSKLWEAVFLFRKDKENKNEEKLFSQNKKKIYNAFPQAQIVLLSSHTKVYQMRNWAFQNHQVFSQKKNLFEKETILRQQFQKKSPQKIQSSLLYFLDEDVILEKADHFETTLKLHSSYPSLTAIGGAYLNHPKCSFFGRVYNAVVKLWMTKHQSRSKKDLLPAGNFSIKTSSPFLARFHSPNPSGFGGEELSFFQSLHEEGLASVWMKELDSAHLTKHRFKEFISRAWLHGRALPVKNSFSKKNFKFFLIFPSPALHKVFILLYLFFVHLSAIQKSFSIHKTKKV